MLPLLHPGWNQPENRQRLNMGEIKPIPPDQLENFYQEVGRTIADWFDSLECPKCRGKSSLDWVFEIASDGKPQLMCRICGRRFLIPGLKFKRSSRKIRKDDPALLRNEVEKLRMLGLGYYKLTGRV
jgi:hypothetical protein